MSTLRKFRKSVKESTLRFDPAMYNNVLGSLVITHYVLRTLDGEDVDVNIEETLIPADEILEAMMDKYLTLNKKRRKEINQILKEIKRSKKVS